jgi:hypothetical protein
MAKKKATAAAPTVAPVNLFAKAAKTAAEAPKKAKGTIVQLPKELDAEGKLVGESAILNNAVTNAITADAESKAALTKLNLAKQRLLTYAQQRVVELYAQAGVLPPTPVSVVNHNGESVTYVMADKSQQNPIGKEQVALFKELLGDDGANSVIQEKTLFFFDFATMDQPAANAKDKTVFEIVQEAINSVMATETRLSEEQKANLIQSTCKTYLKENTLSRIATICGADSARIAQFYDAAGTACVRSIKV